MTPPKAPVTPNLVLRAWRETRGWTRPQMADALNDTPAVRERTLICHAKLIAKWETGEIRWPQAAYRHALQQLTGHDPTALGFTAPAPRNRRQPPTGQPTQAGATGSASIPGTPLTGTDLQAIDDLAALATLLHARGYTTHLATSLPTLIIHHPEADEPLHITATGPAFCWEGTAFAQRPPTAPLVIAADAIGVLPDLPGTPPGHPTMTRTAHRSPARPPVPRGISGPDPAPDQLHPASQGQDRDEPLSHHDRSRQVNARPGEPCHR